MLVWTLVLPSPALSIVAGPAPGTSPGTTSPGVSPALLATTLEVRPESGDFAPLWQRALAVEAGAFLHFRWTTFGSGAVEADWEIRDAGGALVAAGASTQIVGEWGHFETHVDDLSGVPLTVTVRPLDAGGHPAGAVSNEVVLSAAEPTWTCFTDAGVGLPIRDDLEEIRAKWDVPALAAAIVTRSGMPIFDAVGVRSLDTNIEVTPQDKWHLGSVTKSLTATLVAVLIQEDPRIRADLTVGEVFANHAWAHQLSGLYDQIELQHLLAHRSGIWEVPAEVMDAVNDESLTPRQRRAAFAQALTAHNPVAPIGAVHDYENVNFILAGAMLEEILDTSWEHLMQDHLLGPLGMHDTGFGLEPLDGVNQPMGHERIWNDPHSGAPDLGHGPAGVVYTTMSDMGKLARLYLNGAEGSLALSEETLAMILAPFPAPAGEDLYNWGWGNEMGPYGRIQHNGSNLHWYAHVYIYPKAGYAFFGASNVAGKGWVSEDQPDDARGDRAVREAISMLEDHLLGCPDPGESFSGLPAGTAGLLHAEPMSGEGPEPTSHSVDSSQLRVDVFPRQCRARLKPRRRGKVKVAVLSSEGFDATSLDPDSIALAGGIRPSKVKAKDVGGADLSSCTREARRRDGRKDLLLTFRKADLLGLLGAYPDAGDIALTLVGTTVDGAPMAGFEAVPVQR